MLPPALLDLLLSLYRKAKSAIATTWSQSCWECSYRWCGLLQFHVVNTVILSSTAHLHSRECPL